MDTFCEYSSGEVSINRTGVCKSNYVYNDVIKTNRYSGVAKKMSSTSGHGNSCGNSSNNNDNDYNNNNINFVHSNKSIPKRRSTVTSVLARKISSFSSIHRKSEVHHKGVPIPSNSKFKFVIKTVKPELTVSFMLPDMPGYALTTNKTNDVYAEKVVNDPKFWERCSFHPCINMWYEGFCAFESVRDASKFIIYSDGMFYFKKYDGTERFKKDASFVFAKQVPIYLPRRSHSNITPPEIKKLKNSVTKSRKFSLISFRSARNQHSASPSELESMMSHGIIDMSYDDADDNNHACKKVQQKTELFSIGFNNCVGCLHLTTFSCDTTCKHNFDKKLSREVSPISIEVTDGNSDNLGNHSNDEQVLRETSKLSIVELSSSSGPYLNQEEVKY